METVPDLITGRYLYKVHNLLHLLIDNLSDLTIIRHVIFQSGFYRYQYISNKFCFPTDVH
jgi:hypothetical protein